MSGERERLTAALASAQQVARRLRSSLEEGASELEQAMKKGESELDRKLLLELDSFIQRYQQFLEQLTRRVFPALYRFEERLRPPPFAQLLDWLESIALIEQARRWFDYTETRNNLVHEYPATVEERRATLHAARDQAAEMLTTLDRTLRYVEHRMERNNG